MFSDEIVIEVKNLSRRFEIYATPRDRLKQLVLPPIFRMFARIADLFGRATHLTPPQYFREFWALHNVSFQVRKGETLGIVGRNGSGKSTLLQMICGTLTETGGDIFVKGRISALLELGSGFNPEFTGRENVFLNGRILGLSQKEIESRYEAIVEFADIGDFIDQPIKTYSSGMVVRLAFSVAIHVDPEILVVDEALAVGDVAFQRKCMRWMEEFTSRQGVLLFVSHSPEQVRRLCTKAIYLQQGVVVGFGSAKEICDQYEKDQYITTIQDGVNYNQKICNNSLNVDIKADDEFGIDVIGFADSALHYGDERACITGAWIEDLDGKLRSTFKVGESFKWCYRVEFFSPAKDVVFGFMVKTKEGITLFGSNSRKLGYEDSSVSSGNSMIVRFTIEPNLGSGEFFLNCGVSIGSTDQPEFLHRVVDAGIIVISADSSSDGIVNMKSKMHLRTNIRESISAK